MPHFIFLVTDILLFFAAFAIFFIAYKSYQNPMLKPKLLALSQKPVAMVTLVIFLFYFLVALLDSIHFEPKNHTSHNQQVMSVLDMLFAKRAYQLEKTYSMPFANQSFVKELNLAKKSYYPPLKHVNHQLKHERDKWSLIAKKMLKSLIISLFLVFLINGLLKMRQQKSLSYNTWQKSLKNLNTPTNITFIIMLFCTLVSYDLSRDFHLLGTGKIGQDVFYYGIKSIRTGLVIGLLTTLVMLPFALLLGTAAGLLGGKVDDVIQYIYITLSSIPGVLLIAAMILSLQVFINKHQALFPTLIERADARLLSLCIILGITSWTSLCRMLRAETLKLRELEFVQAARALGSSSFRILYRHILPNVMHLVIIAVVLDFSFLVLAEAVLSYIGVGVSPLTISWGNMINSARLELAREPVVWWPMLTAFGFMFILVLAVNLLSDAIRDEFDPKSSKTV